MCWSYAPWIFSFCKFFIATHLFSPKTGLVIKTWSVSKWNMLLEFQVYHATPITRWLSLL
jgi:hypothetical protein